MELKVQKEKRLDDGIHNGVIKDVTYRATPYEYTDLVIELADTFTVTVGYPTYVCPSSKLGKLLTRFGVVLGEPESPVDPDILKGRECSFQSTTEGKFYKVLPDSVKPKA